MFISLLCVIVCLLICRLTYLYFNIGKRKRFSNRKTVKLMAIIGSGGHTSEMIRLLEKLPSHFSPRHYVIANSDQISEKKLISFEKEYNSDSDSYELHRIPRSREVAQSWISTVYTTFVASLYSFPVLWRSKPDVILCNGPGTCIPLCAVAFIYKIFAVCWTDIIYVESLCRVTTMSLSGRILYPFVDLFFIQWPQLLKHYPKAIFLNGRIV